jgi:hypothetical protein
MVQGYPWARLLTRRVIGEFLNILARSRGWNKLYIVSPWLSEVSEPGVPSLLQVAKRLQDEKATAYIVTRPPVDAWHEQAVEIFERSRQASIALVPELHSKLYCARTAEADFALFGSANLTQASLRNLELGLFISNSGDGRHFVKELYEEASRLYRSPTRSLRCTKQFT